MSDTHTRTIPTEYGDVEVDTVKCDSCGEEVQKKHAERFVIGPGYSRENRWTFPRKRSTTGFACPYCAETGPAGFPANTESESTAEVVFTVVAASCLGFALYGVYTGSLFTAAAVLAAFVWGVYAGVRA